MDNNVIEFPRRRVSHEPGCFLVKCSCNELLALRAHIARQKAAEDFKKNLSEEVDIDAGDL
jgi:hypothetical protein